MSRIENELVHGRRIAKEADSIWGWNSFIGKIRAERRALLITKHGAFNKSDYLLEIGCGTGIFTNKIGEKTKATITPIDISPVLIEEAKKKDLGYNFLVSDAMNLPFQNEIFTGVFGSSVLHHLDYERALSEFYRVLKCNGKIVFAEPNMLNPQIFIQKRIPFIKKISGDSPDESAIVRWKLEKLLYKIGYKKVKIYPYDFLHPLTPKMLHQLIVNFGKILEKTPIIKEIAGSVLIYAEK